MEVEIFTVQRVKKILIWLSTIQDLRKMLVMVESHIKVMLLVLWFVIKVAILTN